jgi:glycosyltransferase involved in cell wall biosynthesis
MLEPWAFHNKLWKKLPYFLLIERQFLMGATSLFVTSEMERANVFGRVRHPRIEVLPLGCRGARKPDYEQARRLLGWLEGEIVMLFLSRLDPKKGLHLLLDALASRSDPFGAYRLVIVGDGSREYEQRLHEQARALRRLLPPITWIGPVWGESRWRYLQGADVFVLPTYSENFGIAVLEAVHAGTPVLTTTGTPWRDCAEIDGFFIAEPTVGSVAKSIDAVSARLARGWTEQDRERLASWAEDRYSWAKLAIRYEEAYRRALIRENS